MARVGRPRALDDGKRREVCALVSAGCGLRWAAKYVGCSAATVRREALRNEDFQEQLRKAELAAQLQPLQALRNAAHTHWRAAAWLLERIQPDRFDRRNMNSIKPDEIESFIVVMAEAIVDEIDDEVVRQRVYQRVLGEMHDFLRDVKAGESPFRDPKRAAQMRGKR